MRILTITHYFEAHGGGIERVAGHLCRQFAAQGHAPVWAASREDSAPDGVEAIPLGCLNIVERLSGLPMPVPGLRALRRLRRAITHADAIVVHDALYLTSLAAFVMARRAKTPVLLIQHVADIPFSSGVLRACMRLANRFVTRPMLRVADQTVFISATTRAVFADVETRRPPLTLFNGVDTNVFRPVASETARVETRREHGLPESGAVVLFVGRFVEKKGLTILAALARKRPDLTFALAGRGPIDPDAWNLANVRVLRGLSGVRLAALYRAADVLLLPSVGEGFPLVVQEAMACGLPIICGADTATADPDANRFLTGVAIDLERPEAVAASLATIVDTRLRDAPGDGAMAAYAAKTYDWGRMAAAVVALLAVLRGTGTIVQPARRAAALSSR